MLIDLPEVPTYELPLDRRVLLWLPGDTTAHEIGNPAWSPDRLYYVERVSLAARLRALAEVIDPGSWDGYCVRQSLKPMTTPQGDDQ